MGAAAFDNHTQQSQPHPQSLHHSSLASRRQGASSLPGFELPHPHHNPQASLFPGHVPSAPSSSSPSLPAPASAPPPASPSQKYPLPSNTTPPQTSSTNVRVPNLITPPSNHPSDGAGLSPFPLDSNQFPQPYSQPYWAGSPSYAFNNSNSGRSNSHSSNIPDGLSSYQHQLPPYQSGSAASDLPPPPHQQHTQKHSQQQQQQQQSPRNPDQAPAMAHVMMNTPSNSGGVSPAPLLPQHQQQGLDAAAAAAASAYTQRIYSAPPPQQSYQTAHHQQQPPTSTSSSPAHPQFPQFTRPYPSYSLPALNGPVMSNMHNPNNQMVMLGQHQHHQQHPQNLLPGFNSGHAAALATANMSHMYGGSPQHTPHGLLPPGAGSMPGGVGGGAQADRPFQCDTCGQSFSRNHDLKRHKRIHLAVKPFPCGHCDKSFSRKDALKRHILVKGCGQDQAGENASNPDNNSSNTTTPSTSASSTVSAASTTTATGMGTASHIRDGGSIGRRSAGSEDSV